MRLAGSLPDFLKRCLTRFREERCTQAAASLAFTTLLALVPLLTVALVLITHFDLFSGLGTALRNFLLANLLPEKAGKVIASYALQFSQKTGRLTVLGMGMLVATALLLLLSIDRVFGKDLAGQAAKAAAEKNLRLSGGVDTRPRSAGGERGGGDLPIGRPRWVWSTRPRWLT
ncbi:MAG: YihY family inner membrane protein, partial [Rhodocyclaceae bacterium]|nr:YihY family inner membrane protein [Rhodocyclaceae bacterium]